ncbi:glutathione S-transferase family protein [Phenylobacterium sp.]|uniref:glutathione S-transferase family protein n=1 Tax=Phenylobacterium sp. TaxID=1871053 RepID=UPI0035B1A881
MRIWGRRNSINVQKVLWAADEIGLDYEHIDAGGDAGGLDEPAFRAMNPHGRVPVIDDGGVVVWESNAIVRYLCARYAEGGLCPAGAVGRAQADQWMDWALADFQRDFMFVFWAWYRMPAAKRNMPAVEATWARVGEHLGLLDRELARRPYLVGEAFTMADIPAGTMLYRLFELELERPEAPHVQAWYARLSERSAYQAHVMRPFGELFGRLAF